MKRCERLKKLHHVTCIVVRSKRDSDPFAARRTYNPLVAEFLHCFPCALPAVSERNEVRRCGHIVNVMKRFPAIFASAIDQHRGQLTCMLFNSVLSGTTAVRSKQ
jgi:hypothetical protein